MSELKLRRCIVYLAECMNMQMLETINLGEQKSVLSKILKAHVWGYVCQKNRTIREMEIIGGTESQSQRLRSMKSKVTYPEQTVWNIWG